MHLGLNSEDILPNRILSLRAALLLLVSSAVIIWPLSYWLPMPDFMAALNSAEYSEYSMTLKGIVVVYFLFFFMNLVSVGLAFTKLDSRVKFASVLIPSALLLVAPMLLVIPVATKLSDRGYFTVLQAIFRLLRFTTTQLWATVISVTLIAIVINLFASILIYKDKSSDLEKAPDFPSSIRNRYFIYSGILTFALLITTVFGFVGSSNRALDRQACADYAALAIPETDQGVPTFLSNVQLYGEAAGTQTVKDALVTFAQYSRQYYLLLDSENPGIDMDALAKAIAVARDNIVSVCSEYSVR
jgi:hypothetical protein